MNDGAASSIYLVRHGRTAYSSQYRLNGDPRIAVPLDQHGHAKCGEARRTMPVEEIVACLCSPFPRTRQTAQLLTSGHHIPISTDIRLGELDYGCFEGQPFAAYADWLAHHGAWSRPPGACEAQREGLHRMIDGLRGALRYPRPLLIVTHGLLLSVLSHGTPLRDTLFFAEAPYLTALRFTGSELERLLDRLRLELDRQRRDRPVPRFGDRLTTHAAD